MNFDLRNLKRGLRRRIFAAEARVVLSVYRLSYVGRTVEFLTATPHFHNEFVRQNLR